jgi:BirA family biotin operon repressor/biotin-[acetyl-CoA-carboxylase] ligase
MPSSWSDPDRAPLVPERLRAALIRPGGFWTDVRVVARTGSTNADLLAAAASGAPEGTVLVAEAQTAGQGRLERQWVSPPRSGLTFSLLVRPSVPALRLAWLPLLAGLALQRAVSALDPAVPVALKWPNDLLLGPHQRKGAGVLASTTGPGVVLGMGLNIHPLGDIPLGAGGLEATSLADEGATSLDTTELAARLLTELARLEGPWREAGGDPFASGLHEEYRRHCVTLGQEVRVELAGHTELQGTARYLETDGTLVVRDAEGHDHSVPAGDVVHLRAAS